MCLILSASCCLFSEIQVYTKGVKYHMNAALCFFNSKNNLLTLSFQIKPFYEKNVIKTLSALPRLAGSRLPTAELIPLI